MALEGKHTVASDHVAHLALHGVEAHRAAGLALQVVEDGRQSPEVLSAEAVGAVVQSLVIWNTDAALLVIQEASGTGGEKDHIRAGEFRCIFRPARRLKVFGQK